MKKHKIGVMLESFRLSFEDSLAMARRIGADGLQLPAYSEVFSPAAMTPAERKSALAAIRSAGLEVSALCGDLGGHGFERASDNAAKVEKSKRIVDAALELSASVITTHIGVIPGVKNETYDAMQRACYELGEYAAARGAVFAIETGPETPEVLNAFLEETGSSGLRVNYDPANLVMVTGCDPVAGVKTLAGKIAHTHAKDGVMLKQTDPAVIYGFFAEGGIEDMRMEDYFLELPLGAGAVDLPAWISALDSAGYDGYLTIEREVGKNPAEDIRAAVEMLKKIMEG